MTWNLKASGCMSKKASNTGLPENECKLFTLNQMCDLLDIFMYIPKSKHFLQKSYSEKEKLIFFQILWSSCHKIIKKVNY